MTMFDFTNLPPLAKGEIGEVLDLGTMPDDGFTLQVVRPKSGALIGPAMVALDGTNPEKFREVMRLLKDILTTDSSAYLFGRLSDPTDSFDVIHLGPIMQSLAEVLGARPTGSSNESSSPPT